MNIVGQTPSFSWNDAHWSGSSISIHLHQTGNLDLENPLITVTIGERVLGQQRPPPLEAGSEVSLTFPIPSGIERTDDTKVTVEVATTALPYYHWKFEDQPIHDPRRPLWMLYVGGSLVAIALLFTTARLRRHRHPLVLDLSTHPAHLRSLPLTRLEDAQNRLRGTGHLDAVLEAAEVDTSWLVAAIRFAEADSDERAEILVRRLAAEAGEPDEEHRQRTLKLGPAFPLNLEKLELLLPEAQTPIADILVRLRNRPGRDGVALVIGADQRQREALHAELATDRSNQWAAPSPNQLTALLLAKDPPRELARLLASQVNRIRLSPYQTGQGVRRGELFFGREGLLAHVLNRAPASYLLAGGRQLGKSSLLREIARRLEPDPQVDTHYVVLETSRYDDAQLASRLAPWLGLPVESELDAMLEALGQTADGQRRLLLIDEADALVRYERERDYALFARFRAVAEENRCHVILAGFWDLYASVVLDYQSPIKNFGEVLRIEALELDACRGLATRPLATLGLGWADQDDRERLIRATGQRANLVAIACNEMLKHLGNEDREIPSEVVDQALASRAIHNAVFGGWETLGGRNDPEGSHLDRLTVYATVGRENFTRADVLRELAERGHPVSPERLGRTLERLELAFIIRRQGERCSYRVPLFVEGLRAQEPELMLENELTAGR